MSQKSRKSRHSRYPSGSGGGGAAERSSTASSRIRSLAGQAQSHKHQHPLSHRQQPPHDADSEDSTQSQGQRDRREGHQTPPKLGSEPSGASLHLRQGGEDGDAGVTQSRHSLRSDSLASAPHPGGSPSVSEAPVTTTALNGGAAASAATAPPTSTQLHIPVYHQHPEHQHHSYHPLRQQAPPYSPADASDNWRARPTIQTVSRNALASDAAHHAGPPARPPPLQATVPKSTAARNTAQAAEVEGNVKKPATEKFLQKGAGQGKKMPLRTTKTSQKLVLFPDQVDDLPLQPYEIREEPELALAEDAQMLEALPPFDRPERGTDAERLSKDMRTGLPRVTAYCTAEGYRMADLQDYLQREHRVHTKMYDECLYVTYFFPLILGDGYKARLRSSEPPGHARLLFRMPNTGDDTRPLQISPDRTGVTSDDEHNTREVYEEDHMFSDYTAWSVTHGVDPEIAPGGEVFFFDYGVTVFWNLTEEEELDVLADIARFEEHKLLTDDVQVEEFHFQYDPQSKSSRVFNDMITLRTSNHMIKLTISHAISQSVTLTLFEGRMENTIEYTKHIPKTLAETGDVRLSRNRVTKIVGRLFKLRIAVNLVSNVLDTPEIFWSEPTLQPLYTAVKGYLEITQRAKVLNDRCAVISDLLDMLREHMTNSHVVYLNWIVIWLIVVAVLVGLGEIGVKILSK